MVTVKEFLPNIWKAKSRERLDGYTEGFINSEKYKM